MGRTWLLGAIAAALASGQQAPRPAVSPAMIEGTVRTQDGQPLADSNVLLLPQPCAPASAASPPPPPPTLSVATSDAEGKFSFQTVQPDACYVINVLHPGYPGAEYPPQGYFIRDRTATLHPAAGQRLTMTITLTRAILSGKVTNEAGEPMPGVRVRAMLASELGGQEIQTGSAGEFQFTGLSYGRYHLGFWLPPQESESDYVQTYYPGVQSLADAKIVEAVSGVVLSGLNMQLHRVPVFHVRGKVVGLPRNVSLADGEVRVFLVPPDGDLYATQNNPGRKVGADGTFDYGGLPAGSWTLVVTAHQYNLFQKPIRITDRNIEGLVLTSQVPVELKGTVKIVPELPPDNGPQPKPLGMPGVVRLLPEDVVAAPQVGRVYPDGTFTLMSVAASKYFVDVDPPNGAYLKSVTFAGNEVLTSGIDFTQGTHNGPLQIVVSLFAGRVSGTVKKQDGQPAAGALVMAVATHGRDTGRYPQIPSDQNGEFTLKLAPGEYRLYAWEGVRGLNLNPAGVGDFFKQFESLSTLVTVAENDRLTAALTWITNAQVEAKMSPR